MPSRTTERIDFGKIKEIIAPPNLIELQTNSYKEFLQADSSPKKRQKDVGLEAVFREVFPITSYDEKCELNFDSYEIGEPKLDWLECLREGLTYGAPLYVTFLLKDEKGTKEEKVFMGELPLMTPQGSFVINSALRLSRPQKAPPEISDDDLIPRAFVPRPRRQGQQEGRGQEPRYR